MQFIPTQQDDGSWRLVETQTGKRSRHPFSTKDDAIKWARHMELEIVETPGGEAIPGQGRF